MTLEEFFSYGFLGKYMARFDSLDKYLAVLLVAMVGIFAVGYLLGSLNFAIIISGKTYKQDIRNFGSKNAGMTNMMRTYGKKAAALTLLGDALKAVAAGLIGYAVLGQLGAYVGGLACVGGHMFPIFYKFKGGKGVVTTAVCILMCNPFVFLILITLFIIIVAMTKYISLGSIMCALIYPFLLNGIDRLMFGGCPYVIFALLISVLLIFKHRENFKRLRAGTESKFSFKKTVKPEDVKEEK